MLLSEKNNKNKTLYNTNKNVRIKKSQFLHDFCRNLVKNSVITKIINEKSVRYK